MISNHKTTLLMVAKFAIPIAVIAFLLTKIEKPQWDELAAHPKNYWLLTGRLVGRHLRRQSIVHPLVHAGPLSRNRLDDDGGLSARIDLFFA